VAAVAPPDLAPRSEDDQRAFFNSVLSLARQAESAAGARERDLRLAGSLIRLVFAGPALEMELMPAIAHLEAEPGGTPDVVFHIWDTVSTGIEPPPPPCPFVCFTYRGDIWTFNSQRVRSAFHWSEWSVSLLDLDGREGVYWLRSGAGLPYWAKASPFRTLFHWWMEERGAQLIHAAAVGRPDGGVLITGKGGVGKSSTALACAAAGFGYVADDYLVVTLDPEPVAHSIYCTAKVNADQIDRFAQFKPRFLGGPPTEGLADKAVAYLYPEAAAPLLRSMPIMAVLTPAFGERAESTVVPTSLGLLRGATTFTTLAQLPHAGQRTVDFIERLLARAPGWKLLLGRDLDRVPEAIAEVISGQGEPGGTPDAGPARDTSAATLISVVIPVFNGTAFLKDAVESVLAQGHEALEIIVVDDGSTDAIDEAVAALPVDVRLLKQPNGGPASARNRGIRNMSGDFIAFIDVDDLWPAGKLAAALEHFAEHPETDVVTGYAQLMQLDEGTGTFRYAGDPKDTFPNYIGAALYRRGAFEAVGLLDERLRFGEDTDWFLRAAEAGLGVERLDQVTLLVRRHASNMTLRQTEEALNPLRLFKNVLDRKRAREAGERPATQGASDGR
jgi:hypothetical protein